MADPAISGDSADPDQDGLPNLLEYAFHTDPKQPSTENRPYFAFDANYISIVYIKTLAATDLTYAVEQSTDLMTWGLVTPVNEILSDDGTIQVIKAQVPRSNAGSDGNLFLRLQVTLSP